MTHTNNQSGAVTQLFNLKNSKVNLPKVNDENTCKINNDKHVNVIRQSDVNQTDLKMFNLIKQWHRRDVRLKALLCRIMKVVIDANRK